MLYFIPSSVSVKQTQITSLSIKVRKGFGAKLVPDDLKQNAFHNSERESIDDAYICNTVTQNSFNAIGNNKFISV